MNLMNKLRSPQMLQICGFLLFTSGLICDIITPIGENNESIQYKYWQGKVKKRTV